MYIVICKSHVINIIDYHLMRDRNNYFLLQESPIYRTITFDAKYIQIYIYTRLNSKDYKKKEEEYIY